jgi:hypothetical protein
MKGYIVRKLAVAGLVVAAAMTPTVGLAQYQYGYYFNDGNGNCGYVECGPYGCVVLASWVCPREVSGD